MHFATIIAPSLPVSPLNIGGHPGVSQSYDFQEPFSGFMEQASQQIASLRSEADQKVKGLMLGDGTDIHTALIATQKADLAFDLALAVRNKAVGAYQQLMSMQF